MPIQAPNWSEAREFVELIAGQDDPLITFQVFDDSDAKREELAEWNYGRLSDDFIKRWLIAKANEGCGVYFTLNRCDGKGRRAANVVEYQVAGVDFDGEPLPQWQPLPFDIVVESSPGRYHGYFLLDKGTDLPLWSDTQARLAEFYNADRKVFDPPRVFRLPGFYHQKSTPFRTKILNKVNKDQSRFDRHALAEIIANHPCEYKKPVVRAEKAVAEWPPDAQFPNRERDINQFKRILAKTTPKEGERNNTAYAMAAKANDLGISPDVATELLLEWNEANDVGLPEHEIHHVIRSAPTYKHSPAGVAASVDPSDDFAAFIQNPDEIKIGDEGEIVEKAKPKDRFRPHKIAELLALPAPRWLIKGLMIEGGLFEIYGKFKSGKTFWAVEMSCCIATGHDFFGEQVQQGKVLYIIAEGSRKLFAYRMDAWARARAKGDEAEYLRLRELLDQNIDIVPTAVHINNAETVKAFLVANKLGDKRALVVIDTLFRSFQGNVSEAEAFSKFIEGCDLIRRTFGTAVLFLHHQKRNDGVGGFGSVVGEASVDWAAKVDAKIPGDDDLDDEVMRSSLVPEIMRDGELAEQFNCRINVVKIDDPTLDAEDVNTVGILEFKGRGDKAKKVTLYKVLQTIYDTEPKSLDELAATLGRGRTAVDNYISKLKEQGLVSTSKGKGGVVVTDKGRAHIKTTPEDDFGIDDN